MLLFSLSEELNPNEGMGTFSARIAADRGGMGIGMGDLPP